MTKLTKKILDGWQTKKISEVAEINKGLTYSSSDYATDSNTGIPFFTLKSISKGGGFNKKGIKFYKGEYQEKHIVEPGDLIIANTDLTRNGDVVGAPVIVPKINESKSVISMDISKIELKENTDKLFFYYLLSNNNIRKKMRGFSTGTTVLHLNLNSVKKIKINLPPLPQQKKIAQILSTVDVEIEKTEKIIAKTKELKTGLMQQLFSKGIGHTKFKKTKLGEIPEEWEIVGLNKICEKIIDCPHTTPKYKSDGAYLVVRTPNVRDGKLVFEKDLYTDIETYTERIKRYEPQPGDILLTREAPAGEACLVPKNIKLCLGQRMMCIKVDESHVTSQYLLYVFYAPIIRKLFQSESSGTTVFHFNVSDIKKLKISLPSLREQIKIASILSSVDDKIRINQKIKRQLIQLKKGLMQDLLSGKKLVN